MGVESGNEETTPNSRNFGLELKGSFHMDKQGYLRQQNNRS